MPRLKGSLTTAAPAAAARCAVRSSDPSSITTTSSSGSNARSSSTTPATASSSLRAGTIAMRRCSDTCACRDAEADEREQLPGSVGIGVLVEDALAGPCSHRLRLSRVVEQRPVGRERLVGVVDDEQLLPGLEPALD